MFYDINNEIANKLLSNLLKTVYVDDFALYLSNRNTRTITGQLQLALNQVVKWTQETRFTFSFTGFTLFHTKTMQICRMY